MPDSIATTASRRTPYALRLAALLLALGGLAAAGGPPARAAEPRVAVGGAASAAAVLKTAKPLGRQPLATPVRLALTLPLRNQAALKTLLGRLYDRKDPLYGKFLTPDQFNQQFAPTQADYDAVVQFAQAQGLSVERHSGRTLVAVSGASGAVEKAFGVHLNQYATAEGRVAYANDVAPTVPASIASRITGVIGLSNLVMAKPVSHLHPLLPAMALEAVRPLGAKPAEVGTDAGTSALTPQDIKNVYNLASVPYTGEGQNIAICAPGGGYALSDIGAYVGKYNLPTNAGAFVNRPVNGYDGTVGPNFDETVLDLDMAVALAPRINHVFVYIAPDSSNAGVLATLTAAADNDEAQVVSLSYESAETDAETFYSFRDFQSIFTGMEDVYERMGVQGQSMFVAAGDEGAYADGSTLSVSFLASPPSCTAVGGTLLSTTSSGSALNPQVSYLGESAWGNPKEQSNIPTDKLGSGGGGGISIFWQKPTYQYASTVNGVGVGPVGEGGLFSPAMRDLPDVALAADPSSGYAIYVASVGSTYPNGFLVVGGTSAASPLWAAFTALVNESRALGGAAETVGVSPGTPTNPVGFANPLIYAIGNGQYGSYANDFHDVRDDSTNLFWPATVGYDDATGWGSFNGANLLRDMVAAGGGGASGGGGTTGSTGVVSGAVTLNGTAPNGVTVTVQAVSTDGSVSRSVTTTTGSFSLTLPAGLTYTVSADAPGYIGQSYQNISLTTSGATETFALTSATSGFTYPAGLQMISAPFDFSSTGADFAGLFGLTTPLQSTDPHLILWQAALNQYVTYPTPPADTLRPGIGYWVNIPSGGAYLHRQGTVVSAPFKVVLQAGWNQIGDPFATAESLSSMTVATDSAGTNAAPVPTSALVSPVLYTYPANNGSYVTETGALTPYAGYWIYARQACYLTYN